MAESSPINHEEEISLTEEAYYLFAAASELFSGSITGQGAFIASACKFHDKNPLLLGESLVISNKHIKGLCGEANKAHKYSRKEIPPITISDVIKTVKASYLKASELMDIPQEKLSVILNGYDLYIRPYSSLMRAETLPQREQAYRDWSDKILEEYRSEMGGTV